MSSTRRARASLVNTTTSWLGLPSSLAAALWLRLPAFRLCLEERVESRVGLRSRRPRRTRCCARSNARGRTHARARAQATESLIDAGCCCAAPHAAASGICRPSCEAPTAASPTSELAGRGTRTQMRRTPRRGLKWRTCAPGAPPPPPMMRSRAGAAKRARAPCAHVAPPRARQRAARPKVWESRAPAAAALLVAHADARTNSCVDKEAAVSETDPASARLLRSSVRAAAEPRHPMPVASLQRSRAQLPPGRGPDGALPAGKSRAVWRRSSGPHRGGARYT